MLTLRSNLAGLLLVLMASPAGAEPMRLDDPRPRWVSARFEVSPSDRPDQLDTRYTPPLRAWLEPDAEPGRMRLTIPGALIERHVLAEEEPVPDSFENFVWVFEVESGAVVSARLRGSVVKTLDWGLFRSRVRARIRVAMDTAASAGFEPARTLFGQRLFGYCGGAPTASPCTLVDAVRYDAERGYVNAVGELAVDFRGVTLRTFSPLGEARFSELPEPRQAEGEDDPRLARNR